MADVLDVRGLDEKDIKLLEALVENLKERAKQIKAEKPLEEQDGFKRSAGAWKGLIDPEELISSIYSHRLVSTRSEAKL